MLATGLGGAVYVAMGVIGSPVVAAVLFAVYALSVIVWNVLSMSLRQALIPTELFGRVQGAWRTLAWGAIAVGSLVGGVVASLTSVRTVFALSGGLQMVTAVAVWAVLHRHRAEVAEAFQAEPSVATVALS